MASALEQYRQLYEQAKQSMSKYKNTLKGNNGGSESDNKGNGDKSDTGGEPEVPETPVTPTYNTPTYATSNYSTPSYSQSLFDYFKTQNEKARKSSLDAIMSKLKMGEQQYKTNMDSITDQYQALRNQSEVERYKTQRMMREALANKGQLNSGFGRQEQLLMDTQYGNAINSLKSQEAKAKGEVQNLIAQLRAEAELEKANVENQYNNAIEQYKSQMGY